MGAALCRALGLGGCGAARPRDRLVADVQQHRALIHCAAADRTCLCKGTILPVEGLGLVWRIFESCIKVSAPGKAVPDECLGVDVLKSSHRACKAPRLTMHLAAVLALRLRCLEEEAERAAGERALAALLAEARAAARDNLVADAWGLGAPEDGEDAEKENDDAEAAQMAGGDDDAEAEEAGAPPPSRRSGCRGAPKPCPRVWSGDLKVRVAPCAGEQPPPTPMAELLAPEPRTRSLAVDTRAALLGGAARAASLAYRQARKPQGRLSGLGAQLWAVPDLSGVLRRGECYVLLSNGEAHVGEVAAWRYPCHVGPDVQIWEAKPLPSSARTTWRNAIVCSLEEGARALAVGDYDGDLVN
eukprot:15483719-Alexandrium_andersonii.AAC.1